MHYLILIFLLFCSTFSAVATAEDPSNTIIPSSTNQPKEAIGLSLGWVIANGLSYRRYFGRHFFQGTFAGLVDKDKDEKYIDLSFSYGRYLNTFDLSSSIKSMGLKFVSGIEYEYDNQRSSDWVDNSRSKLAEEIHIGAGFGLDIINPAKRGLVLSLDIIYTASFRDRRKMEFISLNLLPSISIHYNM